MPRNMSFAITTRQFLAQTKDVTRRLKWMDLKVGEVLNGVEKAMGLRKGESIKKLGQIRVLSVRRERLDAMTSNLDYGYDETTREGFPEGDPKHDPEAFVKMFCISHACEPSTVITRIEYAYLDPPSIQMGPVYGVTLPTEFPLGGGMFQAMPGRKELEAVQGFSERTVAAYEVLVAAIDEIKLNEPEMTAMNHLVEFWNAFVGLSAHHPHDVGEVRNLVHSIQNVIASRVARRANPEVWGTFE